MTSTDKATIVDDYTVVIDTLTVGAIILSPGVNIKLVGRRLLETTGLECCSYRSFVHGCPSSFFHVTCVL
jgi:hypothetical protein